MAHNKIKEGEVKKLFKGGMRSTYPEVVDVDVKEHIDERNKEREEEPDLHILDVACCWKVSRNSQEDCGEHQLNMAVRFTDTMASKKNCFRKFVLYTNTIMRPSTDIQT